MGKDILQFLKENITSIDDLFYEAIIKEDDDLEYIQNRVEPSPHSMLRHRYGAMLRFYCLENPEITSAFHYKDWEDVVDMSDWIDRLEWLKENKDVIKDTRFNGHYLKQMLDHTETIDDNWHLAYQYGGNALARAIMTDRLDWLQERYASEIGQKKVYSFAD